MTVIGIEKKRGTFKNEQGNDVAFNTTYIHCTDTNSDTVGNTVVKYKLHKDCKLEGVDRVDDLLGLDVLASTMASQYGVSATRIIVR